MAFNFEQRLLLLSLLLAAMTVVAAHECSAAWKECTIHQCCSTPYFECVERNTDGAKSQDGKEHKAYAQCRDSNHSGAGWAMKSCPCDPGMGHCEDYSDYQTPKKEKVLWTCNKLTGGCRSAYKPCGVALGWSDEEKKTWFANTAVNVPCCQNGCTCKFTDDEVATCQPPEGMFACTKEAEEAGHSSDDSEDNADDLESDVDAQDDAYLASLGIKDDISSSKDKPTMGMADSPPWAWLLIGGGAALVTFTAVALRTKRTQRLLYTEASADAEAASD